MPKHSVRRHSSQAVATSTWLADRLLFGEDGALLANVRMVWR